LNGQPSDYAVKVLYKFRDYAAFSRALKEVETLGPLDHENIVRYAGHKTESGANGIPILKIYMERCGGSLASRMTRPVSLFEFCSFVQQIAWALEFLQSKSVLHRDLKPDNILLRKVAHIAGQSSSSTTVKVADFGLARFLDEEEKAKTDCGTPAYKAPEVKNGQPYTFSADWYSFGVIIKELWSKVHVTLVADSEMVKKLVDNLTSSNPVDRVPPSFVAEWAFEFYQRSKENYDAVLQNFQTRLAEIKNDVAELQKEEAEINVLVTGIKKTKQ